MDTWFLILVSLCLAALIRSVLLIRNRPPSNHHLPPGPPIITSTFLLLTNPRTKFEPILINLKAKYGPFFTLSFGFRPTIFVSSHSLAHQILIQKGALFSDRPKSLAGLNISSAPYGPTWRLFRRNLASEIMHPSRIKSYSWARKWVLHVLIDRLRDQKTKANQGIKVIDHFRYAVFCLLTLICFGDKFDESQINEIANVQRDMLLKVGSGRFTVLTLFPKLGKILFRNRLKEYEKLQSDKDKVLIRITNRTESVKDRETVAYVDTLVNLQLPDKDGNKLTEKEIASLCSEFLNGGTDTTSTSLQWIFANLVKYPHIQSKLYDEIVAVVGPPPKLPQHGVEPIAIHEEELQKMVYLKAVVLEGLRRHPPGHFVLPHKVKSEVEVNGYVIPQGAIVNFMVGEMGLDPTVWDDPMEFKPERFMVNEGVFDISGSKGIKIMPFGAGRRVCPGLDLALLHLEYFVANLVWYFDWSVADGYDVDLSEKQEFTTVMKNPLQTHVSSRAEKLTT
ncbi:cytochrome P450 89A2-like [Rutidosis leptorrhynchoides]|uniref:cytochrome P450 89A2-like n=1 Tax=Rutidosis leptorrhynchoides TaxID=125765 RepID=UPI003A9A0BAE